MNGDKNIETLNEYGWKYNNQSSGSLRLKSAIDGSTKLASWLMAMNYLSGDVVYSGRGMFCLETKMTALCKAKLFWGKCN